VLSGYNFSGYSGLFFFLAPRVHMLRNSHREQ
jgi:hypothetical protein